MPPSKTCLIIAQSGRALATSARMAGLVPYVIDRFADQDTLALALNCVVVSGNDSGFNAGELLEKLATCLDIPLHGVIYSSGLENHYDVLNFLDQHWTLFGNDAAVVKACKEPGLFFPVLSRLGIPHPRTCVNVSQIVRQGKNWIIKKIGASGGGHIRALGKGALITQDVYFQEKLSGRSLSVVFLANALNVTLVGMNELWTVAPEKYDFRYAGAVTRLNLPVSITRLLEDIVTMLARELGLRGLCGMDVIVDDNGQCFVLEVNPRPTATFELHQTELGLCGPHILACEGRLISLPHHADFLRAHQVQYADREFIMPEIIWPDWASDRPRPGRHIKVNDPVCIVHAQATCMNDIETLLQQRSTILMQRMGLQKLAA